MNEPTILDLMNDQRLLGRFFKGDSWLGWRSFLAALFALPLSDEAKALALRHTGRSVLPTAPCREAWACCGRRAGKSIVAALIVTYLALFCDYRPYLAPGELATVMLLACDKRQARTVLRYVKGFIAEIPALTAMVTRETREGLEFANRSVIEIHSISYRRTRGYSLAAAILEEQAFWNSDEFASEPDSEVIASLLPALATIPSSLLLGISSPHGRDGAFWTAHEANWANDASPALFWNADSHTMNPRLDQRIIAASFERDPSVAASEYGSDGFVSFRSDLEKLFTLELLDAITDYDRPLILPYQKEEVA
jgi:hypothetical protein